MSDIFQNIGGSSGQAGWALPNLTQIRSLLLITVVNGLQAHLWVRVLPSHFQIAPFGWRPLKACPFSERYVWGKKNNPV